MKAKESISRDPVLLQRRAVGGVICLVTDFVLSQRRDVVNETVLVENRGPIPFY